MEACTEYIIKMNMYLDGELPANQLSDLMEHLESCESCRKRFDGLKIIAFELRQMEQEPPEMLHGSIMRYVREHSTSNRRKRWVQKSLTVAACAAFLILAASGGFSRLAGVFLFSSGDTVEDSAPVANNNLVQTPQAPNPAAFSAEPPVDDNAIASPAPEDAPAAPPVEDDTLGPATSFKLEPRTTLASGSSVEYSTEAFVLPKLSTSEPATFYVVASGSGSLTDLFPVENVFHPETGSEAYAFVPGDESAKPDTEQLLFDAGFVLYSNVENLPAPDPDAKFGLVVCFEK